MQSSTTTSQWFFKLWLDINRSNNEPLPAYFIPAIQKGYSNLPAFLQNFCFLYYHKGMSLQQVAKTLHIKEHIAKQRWVVSIALFRILLASKPKNPV